MNSLLEKLKSKKLITASGFGVVILAAGAAMGVDEALILELELKLGLAYIAGEALVDMVRAIADALKSKWG